MRKNISSGSKWEPIVGYSRAVKMGDRLEISGTTSSLSDGSVFGKGNLYDQCEHILKKIQTLVESEGFEMKDVIRTRIYLTDISRWDEAAAAHQKYFGKVLPASTMVEVSRLIHPDMLVEIEAVACKPG